MSGKTAPEEATSDRMSAVTASTISLEEQIRNLLGDPSKASSATVPASTSTSKSASSSIMASKESAETKQESHAARGLTTNSVVNVSERGLDSQVTSSRGQANTPTFVQQDNIALSSDSGSIPVLRQVVEDSMADMCADLRGDIQNVHVELLRQFQVQIVGELLCLLQFIHLYFSRRASR